GHAVIVDGGNLPGRADADNAVGAVHVVVGAGGQRGDIADVLERRRAVSERGARVLKVGGVAFDVPAMVQM
ncbi:UNVERIFIED_CONTAM: hypothetical protein DVV46_11295, partial [Lactobacillus paragasseri]|nr:hypothetical protein [Lactobacillus paragasseri]